MGDGVRLPRELGHGFASARGIAVARAVDRDARAHGQPDDVRGPKRPEGAVAIHEQRVDLVGGQAGAHIEHAQDVPGGVDDRDPALEGADREQAAPQPRHRCRGIRAHERGGLRLERRADPVSKDLEAVGGQQKPVGRGIVEPPDLRGADDRGRHGDGRPAGADPQEPERGIVDVDGRSRPDRPEHPHSGIVPRRESPAVPAQDLLPRHEDGALVALCVHPPHVPQVGRALRQASHEGMVTKPPLRPRLEPADLIHPGDPDPAVRAHVQAPDRVGGVHFFRAPSVSVEGDDRVAAEIHGSRPILDGRPCHCLDAGVPCGEDPQRRHPLGALPPPPGRGVRKRRRVPGGHPEESANGNGTDGEQNG